MIELFTHISSVVNDKIKRKEGLILAYDFRGLHSSKEEEVSKTEQFSLSQERSRECRSPALG